MKPGKGRPFKKDITYTEPATNLKDCKKIGRKLPKTSGLEPIASTPVEKRPFTNG